MSNEPKKTPNLVPTVKTIYRKPMTANNVITQINKPASPRKPCGCVKSK